MVRPGCWLVWVAVPAVLAVVVPRVLGGGLSGSGGGLSIPNLIAALTVPEVRDSVDEYSWDELSGVADEIAKASDPIEVAKKYNHGIRVHCQQECEAQDGGEP